MYRASRRRVARVAATVPAITRRPEVVIARRIPRPGHRASIVQSPDPRAQRSVPDDTAASDRRTLLSNDIKSSGPKDQFIRHSEQCWTTLRHFELPQICRRNPPTQRLTPPNRTLSSKAVIFLLKDPALERERRSTQCCQHQVRCLDRLNERHSWGLCPNGELL